jgi:hypothetical protein
MYMILFVLDDPDQLDGMLEAWEAVGVTGVTIIESTGIHRVRTARQKIPMRYMFGSIGTKIEVGHFTLLALVKDEDVVQRCFEATEELIGSLEEPNTGVFSAWPVPFVRGVPKKALPKETAE